MTKGKKSPVLMAQEAQKRTSGSRARRRVLAKLVEKAGGTMDGDTAHFQSAFDREQFMKAVNKKGRLPR